MKKKFLVILVSLVSLVIILSSVVVAQLTELKVIPVDLTVEEGAQVIGVYHDPEMTLETTAIHYGSFTRGTSQDMTLYFRNEGIEPINVNLIFSGTDLNTWGSVTAVPATATLLNAGETVSYTFTLSVNLDAAPGAKSFEIKVVSQ